MTKKLKNIKIGDFQNETSATLSFDHVPLEEEW